MPRSRHAVACEAENALAVVGTGHSESRQVEVVGWIAFVVDDGPDYIRPVEAIASAAVIIFAIVV